VFGDFVALLGLLVGENRERGQSGGKKTKRLLK
jgi:hypothetical protein